MTRLKQFLRRFAGKALVNVGLCAVLAVMGIYPPLSAGSDTQEIRIDDAPSNRTQANRA